MTSSPASPSRPPSIAVAHGVSIVEERDDPQLHTGVGPSLRITAYDGQDPLEYAKAVTGMGPEGNTGDCESQFSTFLTT